MQHSMQVMMREALRSPTGQAVLLSLLGTVTLCLWWHVWKTRNVTIQWKFLWSLIVLVPLAGWVLYVGQRWMIAPSEDAGAGRRP